MIENIVAHDMDRVKVKIQKINIVKREEISLPVRLERG